MIGNGHRQEKKAQRAPASSSSREAAGFGRCTTGIVCLAIGLALGLILSPTVIRSRPDSPASDELVEILVAHRTIPAGTELGYAVLVRAQMPARFVSVSMVRPEHVGQLNGEITLMTVLEGDPILWSYLAAGAPDSICRWVREANEPRARP